METFGDKFVTAIIGCFVGIVTYICTRTLDKWEHKRNNSLLGMSIIESLLKEIKIGLDIIKNEEEKSLPKENWEGIKTIPNEVMSIILAINKSEKNKLEAFNLNEIRDYCKKYFEYITKHWQVILDSRILYGNNWQNTLEHHKNENTKDWQKIQEYQKETEKIIEMLKQTKRLLEDNSKKWLFPK